MSIVKYHLKSIIEPKIIELLKKEGFEITKDNIKIWAMDYMRMSDVKIGCDYVKNKLGSNIIIYTNKVNNIDFIEKNESVKIYDSVILKKLCLKYNDYVLYDLLD